MEVHGPPTSTSPLEEVRLGLFRRGERPIQISVAGGTDVGRVREHNEDRFLVADLTTRDTTLAPRGMRQSLGPRGSLLLVADGMGGALAGEVASQMATDLIYEQLATRWAAESDGSPDVFAMRIHEAVTEANARIYDQAQQRPELSGMGTTATVVGILGRHFLVTQVGDSRAYRVRDGTAVQLTRDQTMVQHLVDTGQATEEEADQSEDKNVILQALGTSARVEPVQTREQIRRGDTFILCSDGLSGLVEPREIAEVVTRGRNLARVCQRLIDLANERGGPDNITVVAARITGGGL